MRALWACAFVAASLCSLTAQQPAPDSTAPRVTVVVNDATAPPDWEARLPLSLVLADATTAGHITLKLTYPAKILRFERIERAEGLEKTGIEIKAGEAAGKDGDVATIAVEIGGSKGAKAIPSGILGNAVFKVIYTEPDPLAVGAEEAAKTAEQDKFPVTAESVQAESASAPFSPLPAKGQPATFTIAPGGLPIFACFLYMH